MAVSDKDDKRPHVCIKNMDSINEKNNINILELLLYFLYIFFLIIRKKSFFFCTENLSISIYSYDYAQFLKKKKKKTSQKTLLFAPWNVLSQTSTNSVLSWGPIKPGQGVSNFIVSPNNFITNLFTVYEAVDIQEGSFHS